METPSKAVSIVWVSPVFERQCERVRPGSLIPDTYAIESQIANRYGPIADRYITEANADTQALLQRFGYQILYPDIAPQGTVVFLGQKPASVTVAEEASTVELAAADLQLPQDDGDARETLIRQASEIIGWLWRLSSETSITRETAHRTLRLCLGTLDRRLAAEGMRIHELVNEAAEQHGLEGQDKRIAKPRPAFALGEALRYGNTGIELAAVSDRGGSHVLCAVPDSVGIAFVRADQLSSTGKSAPAADLMEQLAKFALTHARMPEWGPAHSRLWLQGALAVDTETGATAVVLSGKKPDVLPLHSATDLAESSLIASEARAYALAEPTAMAERVTMTTAHELDTRTPHVVYRTPAKGAVPINGRAALPGKSRLLPYLAVRRGSEWHYHPIQRIETEHTTPLTDSEGRQLHIRTPQGDTTPAHIRERSSSSAPGEHIAVLAIKLPDGLAELLEDRQRLSYSNLPSSFQPRDVVVVRHGERKKKDTMVVVHVHEDGTISGARIAPPERSTLRVIDPATLEAGEGAGFLLTPTRVRARDVLAYVGTCPDADWTQLTPFAEWIADRFTPEQGQVVWSRRAGEEKRAPRPAIVMRVTSDGAYVCRPLTQSPHRHTESGHELLDPAQVVHTSMGSKARDYEFRLQPENVVALAGRLSGRDLEAVLAQPARNTRPTQ